VADLVGVHGHQQVFAAVRRVLLVTGVSEALGAGVLTVLFLRHGDASGTALWRGVFTAVSAFCNAGFALQTDNLVPYQTSPAVLHVVAALIIVGGLGPAVVVVVPSWLRHRPISLQARLALTTTLALLVAPTLAILAFEWDGPLGHLGFWDRIHNAWLQSATLRTAGFNSIGVEGLRPVTLAMMVALMFIGGSPGGTAGGVKTTTLAVLILAVTAALRSHSEIRIAGRRVAPVSVYRAAAAVTLSVFFLGLAVGALLLTQRSSPGTILFEAVSAFGTVGLSIGGTRDLDAVGKIIIMVCMFAGRVGPLSLLLWIADSPREDGWTLPEEQVATG
jgi:trk system potassium uptake protein TrkH